MSLTPRDQELRVYLERFGAMSRTQIQKLFFPNVTKQRCQQRLKILYDTKKLNREPYFFRSDYVYFLDKIPKQIEHMLKRVDAFITLKSMYEVPRFVPEYDELKGFKPDAYFEIWRNGYNTAYFLEIQQNRDFDQQKYELAYLQDWKSRWRTFPKVIILADCKIKLKQSEIRFIVADDIKKASI